MSNLAIRFLALTLFSGILYQPLCAQDPPIKWKQIDRAQLAMSSFPADPDAEALILCDFGESSLNGEFDLVFDRHVRIKILTKAGYEHGTFSITYHRKDERVRNIDGITYTLSPDSSITAVTMDAGSIFEEDVDGTYRRKRFTLPSLSPGCIIDVRYRITASSLFRLRPWRFQRSIPVLWSEYRTIIPKSIAYAGVTMGYETFHINAKDEIMQRFDGEAVSYLRANNVTCNRTRLVLRDAPALRSEPYITTLSDYETRIEFQLAGYADPNGGVRRVLKDWSEVKNDLLESPFFGEKIEATKTIRKLTEKVTQGFATPMEKMKSIYDYVRSSIVWSERNRYSTDRDVDDIVESKNGSSSEITFVLLSMLKSANLEAHPVILSTRSNGMLQDMYPILDQFNYVLARVRIDGKSHYLDATDPLRPYDLLPVNVLNVKGLVISEGPLEWVTLASPKRFVQNTVAQVRLGEDGLVSGRVESREDGYSGLHDRTSMKNSTNNEVAKSALAIDASGMTLDSVWIDDRDDVDRPLMLRANVVNESYAQVAGDMIYVNPIVVNRVTTNPLRSELRKFPVDMAYATSSSTIVRMDLPAGFSVHEPLKNRSISTKMKGATYSRTFEANQGQITVTSTLEINSTIFAPTSYKEIRNFYTQMIGLQAEQIVLSRSSTSAKKN